MKQLTQEVFDGAPDWVKSAAVDSDGAATGFSSYKSALKCRSDIWTKGDANARECGLGYGYDTTDWQNSAIDREVTK